MTDGQPVINASPVACVCVFLIRGRPLKLLRWGGGGRRGEEGGDFRIFFPLLISLHDFFSSKRVCPSFCKNVVTFIPGFMKTGLAKISTHSTIWQFKTIKLIPRPIKSLYLTPGSKLMVPRSIATTPNLK